MTGAAYAKHTARVWHRALNCGFRVTPSGGEDSISNLHRTPALGAARVYADLGGKLEWSRWLDAIREGRTMITNGPLVWLKINGEGPGGEIRLPASGGSVEVPGHARVGLPRRPARADFSGRSRPDHSAHRRTPSSKLERAHPGRAERLVYAARAERQPRLPHRRRQSARRDGSRLRAERRRAHSFT
ncbi:MAG: hypothetical protein R2724_03060 [Bryobacterales bacterium]